MKTATQYDHVAEIWNTDGSPGPTGRFAEVLAGQVEDYSGGVLHAGTPDNCVEFAARCRQAHKLVPTEWQDRGKDVIGGTLWQLVIV